MEAITVISSAISMQLPGRLSTRAVVILLVLVGVAEPALWAALRPTSGAVGEAPNVAISLAQGRGLADAYVPGQGPTAHLLPISPAIAGGIYAAFGVRSPVAEFLLTCWSIGLTIGTYLLLFRAFERLGSSRVSRLTALAFACIAPTYISQEAVDFRIWEGALAAFLCALFLDLLLRMQAREVWDWRSIAGMCLLGALAFFVNPVVGVGVYACAAVACWSRLSVTRVAATSVLATCALALFVVPWALRNKAVLGTPVLLRSNSGVELALANYPGALDPIDPVERFWQRYAQIHPTRHFADLQKAGGEVAYSALLGRSTWQWIDANPGMTLKLALLHLRQTFAPQEWEFRVVGAAAGHTVRALLASLAGILGLVGIGRALLMRRPYWVYPALMVMLPALCLSLFQPIARYTYLFYPLLVFSAADLLTPRRP
jgi:hypothetical protein